MNYLESYQSSLTLLLLGDKSVHFLCLLLKFFHRVHLWNIFNSLLTSFHHLSEESGIQFYLFVHVVFAIARMSARISNGFLFDIIVSCVLCVKGATTAPIIICDYYLSYNFFISIIHDFDSSCNPILASSAAALEYPISSE